MKPSANRHKGPDRRSSKGECGANGLRVPAQKPKKQDPNIKAKQLSGPVTTRAATPEEMDKYFGGRITDG